MHRETPPPLPNQNRYLPMLIPLRDEHPNEWVTLRKELQKGSAKDAVASLLRRYKPTYITDADYVTNIAEENRYDVRACYRKS